jgi:uncharacterized damage-inducible protein DinB
MSARPEVWLRGPVAGVPALLQPVAHSLLQAAEEIRGAIATVGATELQARPGGAASAEYHVRHAMGSLDRLFTYARGESLSAAQRTALAAEQEQLAPRKDHGASLADEFDAAVARALAQLRSTREDTLLDARAVGRQQLPSTVLGLLFHGAEHTLRHAGQVITTVRVVTGVASGG